MNIFKVIPRLDNKVYVYDLNGTIYLYDAAIVVSKHKILENKNIFINRCTILNDTLAWDISGDLDDTKCIDIAPERIQNSLIVSEEDVIIYKEKYKNLLENICLFKKEE